MNSFFRTALSPRRKVGLLLLLPAHADAKICLMLYQVADNGLETFIQQDYDELSRSPLVSSEDVRTWIYYDAKNQPSGPLPNTLDSNGNLLTATNTGSRYITFNRDFGRLQVDTTLPETDSLAVQTIQSFMERALDDCLSDGFDSLMAIFASHGGVFYGFGEDQHHLRHKRHLTQTNQGVATAIRTALQNTHGAPDKLDVLGFDACNMQAFETADDYSSVAQYLLASESLEPAHGWAYSNLEGKEYALDLSQWIVAEYLSQKQGPIYQTPKTLSILDLTKYGSFLDSFETLAADLLHALQSGDTSLHSFLSTAHSTSVAYEGVLDDVPQLRSAASQHPSSLDIGSFLQRLSELCKPTGDVGLSLQQARDAYADMFFGAWEGPGTTPGTGMHILWPSQTLFNADRAVFNGVLFNDPNYATVAAPSFRSFLSWYLNQAVPTTTGGESVCMPDESEPRQAEADPEQKESGSSWVSLTLNIRSPPEQEHAGYRVGEGDFTPRSHFFIWASVAVVLGAML